VDAELNAELKGTSHIVWSHGGNYM